MTVVEALQALELKRPVSRNSIKKAFREQSKFHHPDAGGKSDIFFIVKDAYDLLSKKTDGEINYIGGTPLKQDPDRGELLITDFPFLILLEKVLAKYYRWKSKPISGFLLRRFSKLIRYFFTNLKNSILRKWLQLLTLIVASLTVLPILLALLILSWPIFLLSRFGIGKVKGNRNNP